LHKFLLLTRVVGLMKTEKKEIRKSLGNRKTNSSRHSHKHSHNRNTNNRNEVSEKPGVVPPQGPPQDPEGEKKYKQLMVEAADFENTREMFSGLDVIDTKHPKDEKDFEALATLLAQKLAIFDKSYHFKEFLKSLYRQTAASLKSDDIKELSSVLGMVANEKMKSEKEKQKKKKAPGKRTTLNVKSDFDEEQEDVLDDYSDFM